MVDSTHDISFDSLETLFFDLNLDATPSMFHGYVCGILMKGEIDESLVFEKLEEYGIRTHYIDTFPERIMSCKKVDIIPIEVVNTTTTIIVSNLPVIRDTSIWMII